MAKRLRGLPGLWYRLLGWLVEALAIAYYAGWILPRVAYLRWTGQLPPPRPRQLPVRLRARAWCVVCERVLEEGAVRCPVHPEGEVMLVLRDEGDEDA